MRIVDSGAFCLRALVLAILCTLALAGSAYADESGTGTTQSETTETQGTGETSTGGGTTGESQSGGTTGSGEGASGGGETTETPVEPPPAQEEATGSTGSAGGEPAETPVVTEPAPTEQAAAVLTAPASEEPVQTSSTTSSHTPLAPDAATAQTVVAHADSTGETSLQSQALLGGPLPPPPTAPTARATEEQAPATPATGGGGGPTLTVAQRAGALGCELTALGGSTTDNCTVGWLGAKRVLNPSTVSFVRVVGSGLVAVNGGGLPPGGGNGGATGGSAPVSPAPGPAPSGASGAAVGGSSGVAPSAFLSLAGLLLLAAPRAMRRLRLSCRPLLTACFVLIPERPG
jgi:hypothetical protein